MAFEIRWTRRASDDLNGIVDYLDSQDPAWADAAVAAISEKLESLAQNPFLSSIYETATRGEIREALAASYRIFFVVHEQRQLVRLERIRHVRQQDPDFSE